MSTQTQNQTKAWGKAFSAFLDRRAIIMLFLGFSAGIPILLIFSSLSLWLGEAGIDKAAVTMFSWAALGYSFKFVWAPLIDEIPVPILTKKLGRRRAWLLIAQILIICAICIMAMSNPALGGDALVQMAVGAVLLGFSAATQDIVIDAYRIELAETEMQTVLAATYNAGYRIGMIIAGAGALFIAADLGTAKGNYIYSAWQTTYFIMAAVMLIGIVTTLVVREPQVNRIDKHYATRDYFRLVLVFIIAVATFITFYIYSNPIIQYIQQKWTIEDSFLQFLLGAMRFLGSGAGAVWVAVMLVKLGVVNKQMAMETWVAPIKDFFKRYGVKLALVLLLLIGFYRVSDIIAGVISNVFYQDMNFSKEQIAKAVKVYGVIFSLVGGFLGGLLAQRMNVMKLLFVGAILASLTNLIFIGLVKSGEATQPVSIQIGDQSYQAQMDESGYWKVDVPTQVLMANHKIITDVAYSDKDYHAQRTMPYLVATAQQPVQMQLLPLTRDDVLQPNELTQSVVLEGQMLGLSEEQLEEHKVVDIQLGDKHYEANIDSQGLFSVALPQEDLTTAKQQQIIASYSTDQFKLNALANYRIDTQTSQTSYRLDNLVDPLPLISADQSSYTLSGKVVKAYSKWWLYFAIVVDNLASGLAGAAFIAFLSSLTSVSFTAVQYAIFSSLMTLTPKILGGYSGTIVTNIGYPKFFLMTTLIGIPILFLVVWVAKLLKQHESANKA